MECYKKCVTEEFCRQRKHCGRIALTETMVEAKINKTKKWKRELVLTGGDPIMTDAQYADELMKQEAS